MRDFDRHPWRRRIVEEQPELVERVVGEIRERGPLASRDFEGRGGEGRADR
jgi:uncharacterized protein YcaQ